jgi:hypothetical protein
MELKNRQLSRMLSSQDSLITRRQALALGLSVGDIHGHLARGTWQRVHRNVYRATAVDFAYPLIKLAIEVDGYVWHFTPEQLRRDHRRRNRLLADGWQTLVFTWIDVTQHPHEVAAQIEAALHRLGAL